MDTLQGSSSGGAVGNPQQIQQQTLLPQSNTLQGLVFSQSELNNSSKSLSVVSSCTQNCVSSTSTSASLKSTNGLSSDWTAGIFLVLAVLVVGIFVRKVLRR